MASGWFVRQGEKTFGPFDAAQIRKLAESRKITPKTQLSQRSDGPWVLAESVKGLFSPGLPSGATQAVAAGHARTGARPAGSQAASRDAAPRESRAVGSMIYGAVSLSIACVALLLLFSSSLRLVGVIGSVLGLAVGAIGAFLNASAAVLPFRVALGGVVTSLLVSVAGVALTLISAKGNAPPSLAQREIVAGAEAQEASEPIGNAGTGNPAAMANAEEASGVDGGATAAARPEVAEPPQEPPASEDGGKVADAEPRKKSTDDDPNGWQGAEFGMAEAEVLKALGDRASVANPPGEWGDCYAPMTVQDIQLGGETYVAHFQFGRASQRLERVLMREKGGADAGRYLSVVKLLTKKYGPPAETTDSATKNAAIWAFPRMQIEASLQRLPGFSIIAISYEPATGKATTNIEDNL